MDTFHFDKQSGDPSLLRKLEAQQAAHRSDMSPSCAVRLDRLGRLEKILTEHESAIVSAIDSDFGGRSRHQTLLTDVFLVTGAIRHARSHLGAWMQPRRLPTAPHFRLGSNWLLKQPLGVVGILSPWNYPCNLCLSPAVGAIAAGNRVMLKPSELTPRFSELLDQLIADHFQSDEVTVVLGGPAVGQAFSELPFNHLVFTGSTDVGRKVAQAAARNLVPVTLELGGKSPVIVDRSAHLEDVAAKLLNAKLFNAGQTCIAPDYVMIPPGREDAMVAELKRAWSRFYPAGIQSPDFTSIISDRHYARLQDLVDDARANGATIIELTNGAPGSDAGRKRFVPTLILRPTEAMRVMREEIFGPILPILVYETREQAIAYVNTRPKPLALYWFGSDGLARDRVLGNTLSGGVTINDCMWQFAQEAAPFGGVGASGHGSYHGEYGFRTFSKERPVFYQSKWSLTRLLNPPYGRMVDWLVALLRKS